MLVAALTGGIATGKSSAARLFAAAGAKIVDADRIAREVVAPHEPAWEKILSHFGPSVLLADGTIDRPALGERIFGHPEQKKVLEAIVHPEVFARMGRRIADLVGAGPADALILVDIPLLMEAGMEGLFAEVLLIYAPREVQIERLMARDKIGRQAALDRIGSQLDIEAKKPRATIVIDNSGSAAQLEAAVREAHGRLMARSRANPCVGAPLPFS